MRIGIVGGGQLGRMLGLSAAPLGIATVFLDPAPDACAAVVGERITGAFDDPDALDALAARCDVLTYEFENVDVAELERIAERTPVLPSPRAVDISQRRHREKAFFAELGLAVAPWAYAETEEQLDAAVAATGLPAILKTDRFGYDGKGQTRIADAADAEPAFRALGDVPVCVEGVVDFDREVSVIGTRGRDGETAIYALTENRHRNGVLYQSRSRDGDPLSAAAADAFRRTVERLGYVGTLAIEFFVARGQLIVNEFAPRVHNSGHWTLDAAVTSQFENHVRAVAGLPLGSTATTAPGGMQNFLGSLPETAAILREPQVRLHAYGKSPRRGRKVGHANVVAREPGRVDKCLEYLANLAEESERRAT